MPTGPFHARYQVPDNAHLAIATWFVREGDPVQPGQPLAQLNHLTSGQVAILCQARTSPACEAHVHQLLLSEGTHLQDGDELLDLSVTASQLGLTEAETAVAPTLVFLPASLLRDLLFRCVPRFRLYYFRYRWLLITAQLSLGVALLVWVVLAGISLAESIVAPTILPYPASISLPGESLWVHALPVLFPLVCIVLGYRLTLRLYSWLQRASYREERRKREAEDPGSPAR